MKKPMKKMRILILICMMIFQMMNYSFAASVNWTEENTLYEANITKESEGEVYVRKFHIEPVQHKVGFKTYITLKKTDYIVISRPKFPFYNYYLQQCMDLEGYLSSGRYQAHKEVTFVIGEMFLSGGYTIACDSYGSRGTWRVLSGSDDRAMMHIASGEYSWQVINIYMENPFLYRY